MLFLFIAAFFAAPTVASPPFVKVKRAVESQPGTSVVWHDEKGEAHTAWLDPSLVAEFKSGGEKKINASPVRLAFRAARSVKAVGAVRIWKLEAGHHSEAALQTLQESAPTGQFSPVLRDSASAVGPVRALPGNIIVHFQPSWQESAVKEWAARKKLELLRKMPGGANVFLFKAEPGMAALNLSNEIQAAGEVVAASPDWWREKTKR